MTSSTMSFVHHFRSGSPIFADLCGHAKEPNRPDNCPERMIFMRATHIATHHGVTVMLTWQILIALPEDQGMTVGRYCMRCGGRLARDSRASMCTPCRQVSGIGTDRAPDFGSDFWRTDQMRDAFATR